MLSARPIIPEAAAGHGKPCRVSPAWTKANDHIARHTRRGKAHRRRRQPPDVCGRNRPSGDNPLYFLSILAIHLDRKIM